MVLDLSLSCSYSHCNWFKIIVNSSQLQKHLGPKNPGFDTARQTQSIHTYSLDKFTFQELYSSFEL